MAWIHHNGLRVNADVPDGTIDIWREQGWYGGLHKDTDPDDDYSAVPSVLPPVDDEPDEPSIKARKGVAKKD